MALTDRDVEIRRPCPVQLSPDRIRDGARSWYCGHCEKSVHVLSNMTESEARGFLAQRAGQDVCVTYAVRRDGSIRFRPQPVAPLVPVTALTRRRAVAAVGLSMALAACAPHDHPTVQRSGIEVNETPVDRTPIAEIPDATANEVLVDGEIDVGADEMLVDGKVDATPVLRGAIDPEPATVLRAGGIRPMPIDDPKPAVDEPCDTPKETSPATAKRGRIKAR